MANFIFTTSQVGAEPIVKQEIALQFPDSRLAFSRPGLLTFKLPDENIQALENGDVPMRSVFARTWGFSIGSLRGETVEELASALWEMTGELKFDRIHVFGRDLHKIGDYKFEPRLTEEAYSLCKTLSEACPYPLKARDQREPAQKDERVLDVILVNPIPPTRVAEFLARRKEQYGEMSDRASSTPSRSSSDSLPFDLQELLDANNPRRPEARDLSERNADENREKFGKSKKRRNENKMKDRPRHEWIVGWHRVHSFQSAFPGGMLDLEVPREIVSRAWLKMEEAIRWSHFPIFDARVCEIGSAPGGATQALLSRGCQVTGVDPAEMAPEVMENPNFRHIRSRIAFVKRSEFRRIRWITCDINVPPNYTLDVIESVVMHPDVSVRGMLLTLKFPDWNMGFEVKDYISRIKSWGFNIVRARQLHYSHQEICVACLKKPFKK